MVNTGRVRYVVSLDSFAESCLTCVCPQVSLQVRALEVGLLAAGEVADVVSSAGEVGLRAAAARSCRHVDWGGGQG